MSAAGIVGAGQHLHGASQQFKKPKLPLVDLPTTATQETNTEAATVMMKASTCVEHLWPFMRAIMVSVPILWGETTVLVECLRDHEKVKTVLFWEQNRLVKDTGNTDMPSPTPGKENCFHFP